MGVERGGRGSLTNMLFFNWSAQGPLTEIKQK